MPNTAETWLENFIANTTTSGHQNDPIVTQLSNGNILVSWDDNGGTDSDVRGQIFDPGGNPVGSEFRLNYYFSSFDEHQHSVDALVDGGFMSVYAQSQNGETSILMDRFDNDGTHLLSKTTVAQESATTLGLYDPTIAVSSTTSVLIAYEEIRANGTDSDIMGVIYNPLTNSFSDDFSIFNNTQEYEKPDIVVLPNGNYAVVAAATTSAAQSVSLAVFDPAGNLVLVPRAVGDSFTNPRDDHSAKVAALTNGDMVVTWTSSAQDGSDKDIKFQIYDAAGNQLGTTRSVNDTGNSDDYRSSDVSALNDGGFAIFYEDYANDQMVLQRFDANGNEIGNAYSINVTKGGEPHIQQLDDGRIVLTYQDYDGNGGNTYDTYVEIIDFRDSATETSYGVIGTINGETLDVPGFDVSVFAGAGDDIIVFPNDGTYTGHYDGGAGYDIITFDDDGTFDLRDASLNDIEGIEFEDSAGTPVEIAFTAEQVHAFTSLHLNGSSASHSTLQIYMANYTSFGLNNLTFEDWTPGQNTVAIYGDLDDEYVTGSTQGDIIYASGGHDIIAGYDGNDFLYGGSGNDVLSGGTGNDTLIGGGGFDTLDGGAGDDTVYYTYTNTDLTVDLVQGVAHVTSSFSSLETLARIENVLMGGGDDTVIGNAVDNVLSGGAGDDNLQGRGGDDILQGASDDDTLVGHSGNDVLYGGDGADIIEGNSGNDLIYAGDGVDTINAGGGNDTVNGGDGDDDIAGATGNDAIDGGAGDDYIHGGNQQDILIGSTGNDTIEGGAGNDIIDGGGDDDMLIGNSGADTLYGGNGHDTLEGSSGGDDLFGGNGDDVLNGGGGNDILTGGVGADDFVFNTAFGVDRIKDFQNGIDDIDFSGHSAFNDFAGVLAAASQVGANVRIDLNANNTLVIENFDLADMDATDFIF